MTLIELGEVSSGSEPDEPAAPTPRSHVRRVAVLVVAVLCVLTVTGSERPEPRGLTTLWSMPFPGNQFTLAGDTLFTLAPGRQSDLTAYDVEDGSVRWTRTGNHPEIWLNAEVPGVLLVPLTAQQEVTEDGRTEVRVTTVETVALDPRTGAERWRARGDSNFWSGGLIMMTQWDVADQGVTRFEMVRIADGTVAWTMAPRRRVVNWTTTGPDPKQPDRMVTVDVDGRIEVRRITDGAVITAATLPAAAPLARAGQSASLESFGGVLFTMRDNAGRQDVTAYETDTLRPRWSMTTSMFNTYFGCGRWMCFGVAPRAVEAVDPATGRVVWRSEDWDYARPLPGGRLLLTEPHQGGFHGLIDLATGRRLTEFDTGSTYVDPVTGRVVTVTLTTAPPAGSLVSQLLGTDENILRGMIAAVGDGGCQLAGDRLACQTLENQLIVTDVG